LQPEFRASNIALTQFWGGMVVLEIFWFLMAIFTLQSPGYLIVCAMAFAFVGMNLLGYYRCRNWSGQQLKSAAPAAFTVPGFTQGAATAFFQVGYACLQSCMRPCTIS
jgi:hypothetical protein